MRPVEFVGQNHQIAPPADMADRCDPLMLRVTDEGGDRTMTSCWKLDADDLADLERNGGHIYITIIGYIHPPIRPSTRLLS